MAPIKRKGNVPEDSSVSAPKKRAKLQGNEAGKESNREKKAAQTGNSDDTSKKERNEKSKGHSDSTPKSTKLSTLRDEPAAFPRGGNSVLTPLERKQIQIQATKDVLFEQKAPNGKELVNSDDEGGQEEQGDKPTAPVKSKKRKTKSSKKSVNEEAEKPEVKIEGLNYKRIIPGSNILGQVSSVGAHDISLALPNNLTGYIPLTAVSKVLSQKIDQLLTKGENEDGEGSESDDDDTVDLKSYFQVGQYLRASVTSTKRESENGKSKGKKHIELSIDPVNANAGLSKSDIVVNATVQASVISVEDHGLVMDFGLDDDGMKGFISSKELPSGLDISTVKEGTVLLCVVTGHNAGGNVAKLSANLQTAASIKKSCFLDTAPTINSFLPGTAAEILLTDVSSRGMAGKIMGMLDAVVDVLHAGSTDGKKDLAAKYNPGAKVKGRLICTYPKSEPLKLGFSLLENSLKFSPTGVTGQGESTNAPSISAIIPEVKVTYVDPIVGLYVQLGASKQQGFVHISRVSDERVTSLSADDGPYKVGSTHEARVVGFSPMDNLSVLSLERKVIDQPFLRLEDVTVGSVVKGKIEKLMVGPNGIDGLIVSLTDGISGLVPGMHMADTKLQHPEKKFREGLQVSVRVLSVNTERRQLRLTLKKSLLHSESPIWKDYKDISAGNQSPGTLISIKPNGAVVQFYDTVRGFLPVSEMSEAYIKDPSQHFTPGQVVNVHALSVDVESNRLIVSCKDPSTTTDDYKSAFAKMHPGILVSGTVFEKSADDLLLKLESSGLVARLDADHVSDGASSKKNTAFSRIRVGQKLHELLILNIHISHRLIKVTNKSSLKQASQEGRLPGKFEDLKSGSKVSGWVKNITADGVFVEFLGGLTGLLPKRLVDDEHLSKPSFGLARSQIILTTVSSVNPETRRFALSMKPVEISSQKPERRPSQNKPEIGPLANPVDEDIKSIDDIVFGRIIKVKVTSVKDTQLNVLLADGIQGRIDVSEAFDAWEDIKDCKQPLGFFRSKQTLSARVLGVHDAKSHKFLPISHRGNKMPVFELSIKPSNLKAPDFEPLSLEKVQVGDSHIGFVNNIADDCLWLNISPNVRGRLRIMDLSDDLAITGNIKDNFPVGSALKVTVTGVDADKSRLDLSAKSRETLTVSDLSKGMILLGRVTRVTERQIIVQINDTVVGVIGPTEMADDYAKINTGDFHKNELLRVCVVDVDIPNKKISFSTRPSKVLSSSLPVEDPEISSISQLQVNDIVRGFVRRVDNVGLFVTLGCNTTAYVRVSDLSDSFLKEWKEEYQVDQLVRGRIIMVDTTNNKVRMSLKESALDPNYKTPLTIKDLKRGQIVTGKVRKVEEYGAFISIDGSANLSGLCHRTEMADQKVPDAKKLYEKDDIVKAKVLKVDLGKEQISLGLKVSYFKDDESEEQSDSEDDNGGMDLQLDSDDDSSAEDDDVSMGGVELDADSENESSMGDSDVEMGENEEDDQEGGLVTGGFDWTGDGKGDEEVVDSNSDGEDKTKKKKRRKPEIKVDRTGDLDANGPQTVADYERLLLGEPDSSLLWLKYMAFQLELGEADKARDIAERAIRTISMNQDTEKLNVWVALLNLENTFGNDDTLDEVFKRACQHNDAQEIYERMASIFIQSEKTEKADDLFQTALKRKVSRSPEFFLNYANFLFDTLAAADRGRALLPRALQSLPPHTHVDITSKFGQLEFRSPNGDVERGRTVFEGLLSSFPKRVDLWNVLLDLEIKVGDAEQVRRLFERALGIGHGVASDGSKQDSKKKLKDKQAKFFFKKWLEFEEKEKATAGGNEKKIDEVKARAAQYVKSVKGGA